MHRSHHLAGAALLAAALFAGHARGAVAENWHVGIGVLPNPMRADEPHARVLIKTHVGARCLASIVYLGTRQKASYLGQITVKTKAVVSWNWHNRTTAKFEQAVVTCTYKGTRLTSIAYFTVKH